MISLSIIRQNHLSTPTTVPPAVRSWKGNSDLLPPFALPSYTVEVSPFPESIMNVLTLLTILSDMP